MRTGNDPQCTIRLSARVEVKADGKHPFKHCGWGLNVEHIGLYRPGSESFGLYSLLNSNRHILMPRHLPIRAGNLVEQDSPNREAFRAKHRFDQFANDR